MSTENPLTNAEISSVNDMNGEIDINQIINTEDEVDKATDYIEINSKKNPKLVKQDKIEKENQDCKSQVVETNTFYQPLSDNTEKHISLEESKVYNGRRISDDMHKFDAHPREKSVVFENTTASGISIPIPVEPNENSNVGAKLVKQNTVNRFQESINNVSTNGAGVVAAGKLGYTPSIADERLAERRKSFTPMSSMEEENLRERLHFKQLRKCNEIVCKEQKYTREMFRRLFQSQVSLCVLNN